MDNPQPGYPKVAEIEEEGARYYSRERFFPFPAKRVIQGDHCWVFGQDNLTKTRTFVFTHFRRKNVISRWGIKPKNRVQSVSPDQGSAPSGGGIILLRHGEAKNNVENRYNSAPEHLAYTGCLLA